MTLASDSGSDRARADHADAFVQGAGWGEAQRGFLAGDASNRRYERLRRNSQSAVLMDAPPEKGEDVVPFVRIAGHLHGLGLSAPRIMAEDHARGFLLLEDLGDDLFARVLQRDPGQEAKLYGAAVDVLAHLAQTPPPSGLPVWGPERMGEAAALAVIWYRSAMLERPPLDPRDPLALGLAAEVCNVLRALAPPPSVLVLRDFHAENLLWLPARTGLRRVGLLDFQSAEIGPPGYDLISMLQDARRDVGAAAMRGMTAKFAAQTGQPLAEFQAALAALGAQRALRILGVFARLCLRDGKPGYLRLLPRVWAQLAENLGHPALARLRDHLGPLLPAPDAHQIARIQCTCAPRPTV